MGITSPCYHDPVRDRCLESAPCLETNWFNFASPVTVQFHDVSVKPRVVRASMRRLIVASDTIGLRLRQKGMCDELKFS